MDLELTQFRVTALEFALCPPTDPPDDGEWGYQLSLDIRTARPDEPDPHRLRVLLDVGVDWVNEGPFVLECSLFGEFLAKEPFPSEDDTALEGIVAIAAQHLYGQVCAQVSMLMQSAGEPFRLPFVEVGKHMVKLQSD